MGSAPAVDPRPQVYFVPERARGLVANHGCRGTMGSMVGKSRGVILAVVLSSGCSTSAQSIGFGTGPAERQPATPIVGGDATVMADASSVAPPNCLTARATCPTELPEAGAPCPVENPLFRTLICEYGDDPRIQCNVKAACGPDGGWSVGSPLGQDAGCRPALPPGCPASFAAALDAGDAGPSCPSSFECFYPEGTCGCGPVAFTPNGQGYEYGWGCGAPAASCPAQRPRLGTPCAGATDCWYTTGCNAPPFLDGAEIVCSCGAWRTGGGCMSE
jgi:hypothetical protein